MIQVLNRACDILELLANSPEKVFSLSELARTLGLNPGTCANILKTLVSRNLVEQVAPRKGYCLGPMAYNLARNVPYRKDLIKIVQPFIENLVRKVKETALVATLHNGKRFVLFQMNGSQALQIRHDYLFRDDIYTTATGKLLIAYLFPQELSAFIEEHGLPGKSWPEIKTKKQLNTVLAAIREAGISIHSPTPEVTGIAVPLKEGEKTVAALGLFLPTFRFKGRHKKLVIDEMKQTAKKIGLQLNQKIQVKDNLSIKTQTGERKWI